MPGRRAFRLTAGPQRCAVLVKLGEISVDPLHQLPIVFTGQGFPIHVPQGQLLRQDLIEHHVLILLDGLVDAAVGKGPGGDQLSLIQFHQLAHAMMQAVGENQALHLVVFPDAVVLSGGIDHPVSYVYQICCSVNSIFMGKHLPAYMLMRRL